MQTFADYVSASEALQEIRGRAIEAEIVPATVQPEPAAPVQPDYRVGDSLYLDGKAFTIEKVGLFDVPSKMARSGLSTDCKIVETG